ncbi:hypothetical protein NDU88_006279 [Pleurodeles waltl]|uniref:Uncharacterized protein n=1 Tax=Pleurodeles waltl TaxID=8319 RepID=A0AAV7MFE3_PLEWA|nr:hypothetical protein NDU88_006279 [Pleurodeles waltl]
MPPVLSGRRGSRATQRPEPSARAPDLQAARSRPSRHGRDPQARREKAVNCEGEGGGGVARHHRRYGPPEHPNERCHGGPPGFWGECADQSHSARRPGARRTPKRPVGPPAPHRNCRRCNGGKPPTSGVPPPSHRSASAVLAGEFSKLGPRRSRASRSAGHLAAG